jgi:acetyl-CoA/propionyl-CoA carboxylase biotin carboxyl carrier protein
MKIAKDEIGFPVAIKAAGGGGGKGFRVALTEDELEGAFEGASREGEKFFSDGRVYLERYLPNPRHVEVQILADKHGNCIHLGERDCSIQRRHQKLIEEAPAPVVEADPGLRDRIGAIGVNAAKAVDYVGAGTIEGLFQDGEYFFLEMNTRVQVEHCVTEMVSGVDIVKTGIRIAAGEGLPLQQDDIRIEGHAIEFRINAEDPAENFMPSPGVVTQWIPPGGPWVRLDSHVYQGYLVPPFYDSLLGKLIVWGRDREECLARSRWALDQFLVDGVKTVIPFHRLVLDHPLFKAGDVNTHFIEDHLD